MVIGGLISANSTTTTSIDKTNSGAGRRADPRRDVPVERLEALQRERAMVIVVTPYLVKPVNANDIVLPTDGYKAPTDLDRVLMGQLGGGTTGGERPKPSMAAPAGGQPGLWRQRRRHRSRPNGPAVRRQARRRKGRAAADQIEEGRRHACARLQPVTDASEGQTHVQAQPHHRYFPRPAADARWLRHAQSRRSNRSISRSSAAPTTSST